MAYADAFDPTKPDASHYASTGPAEIQAQLRAIRDRLDSFTNFSASTDATTDPVKLDANTIETAMLKDLAVTTAKIALGHVGTLQVADGAITEVKLGAGVQAKLKSTIVTLVGGSANVAQTSLTTDVLTRTVNGVLVGDRVLVQPNPDTAAPGSLLATYCGYVSAPDQVTIYVSNPTAGALNHGAISLDELQVFVYRP